MDGRPVEGEDDDSSRPNRWSRTLFYVFPLSAFVVAALAAGLLAYGAPAEPAGPVTTAGANTQPAADTLGKSPAHPPSTLAAH